MEPERVSWVGTAYDAKLGAVLETEEEMLWIGGLDSWPDELHGARVRVEGVLQVREDLPAFVRREGEPERSGIPVSSPEELPAARRRTVIEEATWKLVGEADGQDPPGEAR